MLLPLIGWGQLKSFYKLSDASDQVGVNNGTATNVTYGWGRMGNSAIFNASAYILLPYTGFPTGSQSFTVSMWIYPTSLPSGYQMALCVGDQTILNKAVVIYTRGTSLGGGGTGNGIEQASLMAINNWYHVVVTYDGTYIRTYLNGVQIVGSPKSTSMNIDYSKNKTYIGAGAGDLKWTGRIDDVKIESGTWSPARVKNEYAAYKGLL